PLPDNAECVGEQIVLYRYFPLGFARQMLARPAREGVGLVIADVTYRQQRIDRTQSAKRHRKPGTLALAPITRCLPALRFDRRPAVGQPQSRRGIATIGHELEPIAIGDQTDREPHRLEEDLMRRLLVIET